MSKASSKIIKPDSSPPLVNKILHKYLVGENVSISLKYLNIACECFSNWEKEELKSFSNLIEKLKKQTQSQIKTNTKNCHAHKGSAKQNRFSKPTISDDIKFYSLRVNNKARVHGFFIESVFFLVWLDRNHECLEG